MSKLLYLIGCTVLVVLIVTYNPDWFRKPAPKVITTYREAQPMREINPGVVMARALYAKNTNDNKTLLAQNAEVQLPLASVTKVMTAVVALENIAANARVEITAAPLLTEGESGLIVGEEWKRDDLVAFMLVGSSNDAAAVLADAVQKTIGKSFILLMNEKARALGLAQTFYFNPSGLDLGPVLPGSYGSAHDQALLIEYAQKTYPEMFEKTTHKEERFQTNFATHVAQNTNGQTNMFTGLRASKTGLTDLAGGNLVLVYDLLPNLKVASAVLGSTETGRFKDSETILQTFK